MRHYYTISIYSQKSYHFTVIRVDDIETAVLYAASLEKTCPDHEIKIFCSVFGENTKWSFGEVLSIRDGKWKVNTNFKIEPREVKDVVWTESNQEQAEGRLDRNPIVY